MAERRDPGMDIDVVAAAFPDRDRATSAELQLRRMLDVEADDVAVFEAGGDTRRRGLLALLAGRFRRNRKPAVEDVVAANGGEIVADVPEEFARDPRSTPART